MLIVAQELTLGEENWIRSRPRSFSGCCITDSLFIVLTVLRCKQVRGRESDDILCSPNLLFKKIKPPEGTAKVTGNKTLPGLCTRWESLLMYHFGSAVHPKGGSIMVWQLMDVSTAVAAGLVYFGKHTVSQTSSRTYVHLHAIQSKQSPVICTSANLKSVR